MILEIRNKEKKKSNRLPVWKKKQTFIGLYLLTLWA